MGLVTENESYGLNRMTKKAIVASCKKNKLYVTPNLNDVLYLHFQGYQKIEDLDEYTGLKCLWLESNAITQISGLENQKLLKCLFLHNNLIEKIENLSECKELDTINLSHNQVNQIGNCGSDILPVLNTLNLANNYLRSVESIEMLRNCHHLSVLDLSNNRLDDILIVKVFADMPELKVLVLTGNPVINDIPSYRKTLIVECKKLTYLDTRPVFPRDRACAEAWKRGGFQEERQENIRWNKEERREMLRSVNTTLRMRNRGGGEPEVQLIPTDSSDDDEYYSREMRPKQCEDVSSTQQWDIVDEIMRNPETSDNYQSCQVCGSAYCKFQHIGSHSVEEVELSTEEIIESSNFSNLWGDDNLELSSKNDNTETDCQQLIKESINETASCSYDITPNTVEIESNNYAECDINDTRIVVLADDSSEMLNNISELIKVSIFPEDSDSDEEVNGVVTGIQEVVSKLVDDLELPFENKAPSTIEEMSSLLERNASDQCDGHLISEYKGIAEINKNIESGTIDKYAKKISLECCINVKDSTSSFNPKSNENEFSECHIKYAAVNVFQGENINDDAIENIFKSTDLSTLWEESSLAELDENETRNENNENVKTLVRENNCVDNLITEGTVNVEEFAFSSAVNSDIQEGMIESSLAELDENETRNENNENVKTLVSENNCVDNLFTQCTVNIEEFAFSSEVSSDIQEVMIESSLAELGENETRNEKNENVKTLVRENNCVDNLITQCTVNIEELAFSSAVTSDIQEGMIESSLAELDENETRNENNENVKTLVSENNCVDNLITQCTVNIEELAFSSEVTSDIQEVMIESNLAELDESETRNENNENVKTLVRENNCVDNLITQGTVNIEELAFSSEVTSDIQEGYPDEGYPDFILHNSTSDIESVNINHAVSEAIENIDPEILLSFECVVPNLQSANENFQGNLEDPTHCNINVEMESSTFKNTSNKSDPSQDNNFLITRIKKNCFELNELLEPTHELCEAANIISTVPADQDVSSGSEEFEDVDSSSRIDTLGYSTFVASFEQFFNEHELKSAELIKTVDFSSLCTEENESSIDHVQEDEIDICTFTNVDEIPAMKNFREYRAHLKSLLHRDSELRVTCNELLNDISQKLEAIDGIGKLPPAADEASAIELSTNPNNLILTPSNSFYKICYDDPNSSLEFMPTDGDVQGIELDVNLDTVKQTEDDESHEI